jgi:hypothetical protein
LADSDEPGKARLVSAKAGGLQHLQETRLDQRSHGSVIGFAISLCLGGGALGLGAHSVCQFEQMA